MHDTLATSISRETNQEVLTERKVCTNNLLLKHLANGICFVYNVFFYKKTEKLEKQIKKTYSI